MNWDQIEGNWKQFTGQARVKWAKLTDDDLEMIAGRRDILSGQIQEKYGFAKYMAEKEIDHFAQCLAEIKAEVKESETKSVG